MFNSIIILPMLGVASWAIGVLLKSFVPQIIVSSLPLHPLIEKHMARYGRQTGVDISALGQTAAQGVHIVQCWPPVIGEFNGNYWRLWALTKSSLTHIVPKQELLPNMCTVGVLREGKMLYFTRQVPTRNDEQAKVVDQICKEFEQRGRAAFLLYGRPGTGKTTIGYLVGQKLGCLVLSGSRFVEHGINHLPSSRTRPVVFLIDEFDMCIDGYLKTRYQHCYLDRLHWMLDVFDACQGTIVIATTNNMSLVADWPAIFRRGRISNHVMLDKLLWQEDKKPEIEKNGNEEDVWEAFHA